MLVVFCVSAFAAGYGVVSEAYPSVWPYGRNEYYGYFQNVRDTSGKYVLSANCSGSYSYWNGQDSCNSFPNTLDTAGEFTSFVIGKLSSGSATDRVGAAFIIQTMIGTSRNNPPTSAEQQEFINRVNALAPYTLWSSTSFNYNLNSYNQRGNNGVGPNDIALYDDNASGHRAIIFRNSSGGVEYVIKTRCANPIGYNSIAPLPPAQNFSITGRSTVSNTAPTPGSTITFRHYVRNNGPTSTSPTNIWWIAERTEPAPLATVGGAASSGIYASGEEKNVFNHNVIIPIGTPPGTRFCERVGWDPVNSSGARDGRGTPVCATVPYNFDLTPSISTAITSGGTPVTGNVAESGDSITFTYAVNNPPGSTVSQSVTCTYRQQTWPGNNQSAPTVVFTPAGANCPPNRTFPANSNTTTATETVPAASANTTICRSFTISPITQSGGSETVQACVLVAAKPYSRVWGGDVSAGNGLSVASGSCTQNNDGAIVGWNKRAAGSNAGAGVRFAAYALARITDFASALYDPGGAPSPNGLSFANTSGNAANGDFGGSFGTVPCIPDYYATRPDNAAAIPPAVAAMVTGVYGGSGNVTLGGGSIVNPNNRITVYVDGNVHITTNVAYAGSWGIDSVPLFELIVRGNIYIDNDVTQLDGVYVAQRRADNTGGEIHTCATGFAALPFSTLYSTCDTKLTVNGLFTAHQIRLLRTIGSLSQSNTSEASTSPSIAETFNYGPAVWVSQPVRQNQGATPDYDAIISLPPIL